MADRRRQRASQDSEDDSDSAASDSGDSAASAARSRSGSASPRPSHRPPRGAAGALSAGPRGRGADSAAGGGAAKSAPQSECVSGAGGGEPRGASEPLSAAGGAGRLRAALRVRRAPRWGRAGPSRCHRRAVPGPPAALCRWGGAERSGASRARCGTAAAALRPVLLQRLFLSVGKRGRHRRRR